MRSKFRYSRDAFRRSVVTAIGLTAIVTFLIWLFARLFGLANAGLITIAAGTIFFGFCSAAMILRYATGSTVLAFRPDGLFDRRHTGRPIPWDDIREMRLTRSENEFQIAVSLWPGPGPLAKEQRELVLDLGPLDADVGQILESLQRFHGIIVSDP